MGGSRFRRLLQTDQGIEIGNTPNPTEEIQMIVLGTELLIRGAYEIFSLMDAQNALEELALRSQEWRSTLSPV